jgi:hypothetical protein
MIRYIAKGGRRAVIWPAAILCGAVLLAAAGQAGAIERRRPQFTDEPAHLVLPMAYNLPGLGGGWGVMALLTNMAGTRIDAYAVGMQGDLEGGVLGVLDMQVIHERLILSLESQYFTKAAKQLYTLRGMDSRKDDFMIGVADKVEGTFPSAVLTFADRMVEFGYMQGDQAARAVAYVTPSGVRYDLPTKEIVRFDTRMASVRLDWTDDYYDPHLGLRLLLMRNFSAGATAGQPVFNTDTYLLTGYIPLGKRSTWVLATRGSGAAMEREGLTDRAAIRAKLQPCFGDPACNAAVTRQVENTYNANKYGTAASLGGDNFLRGYPADRFVGSQSLFYGTELRWDFTDERSPFDYFVWKDIRTALQLAFFYETGSVGDAPGDVGKSWRDVRGVGFRFITHAGFAYRFDYSVFDEGSATVIMFSYPW